MRKNGLTEESPIARAFRTACEKKTDVVSRVSRHGGPSLIYEIESEPGIGYFTPISGEDSYANRTEVGHQIEFTKRRGSRTVRGFRNLTLEKSSTNAPARKSIVEILTAIASCPSSHDALLRSFRERHPIMTGTAAGALILALVAPLAWTLYGYALGYQSDKLDELARPVVSAMNIAGISKLECDVQQDVTVQIESVNLTLPSEVIPTRAMPCPVLHRLIIEEDRSVRIMPLIDPTPSQAERELKSQSFSMRKKQFDDIALSILKNNVDLSRRVALSKNLELERENQRQRDRSTWH